MKAAPAECDSHGWHVAAAARLAASGPVELGKPLAEPDGISHQVAVAIETGGDVTGQEDEISGVPRGGRRLHLVPRDGRRHRRVRQPAERVGRDRRLPGWFWVQSMNTRPARSARLIVLTTASGKAVARALATADAKARVSSKPCC